MRIDILTLFPGMFAGPLDESIVGRARQQGMVQVHLHNIRDWAADRHRTVDDTPYGGGAGMVMRADVLGRAIAAVQGMAEHAPATLLSPQGRVLDQGLVQELAGRPRLLLVCGHYEGVDERAILRHIDEEISIGDYVLTGGELPAMVLVDAVARLVPGVLDEESLRRESHHQGLLEHPQYTRPAVYEGLEIPPLLLSGHHAEIERYRRQESLRRTMQRRPDLLARAPLTDEDRAFLLTLGWPTPVSEQGPTVLPAVQKRYGRYWSIQVSRTRLNPPGTPGTRTDSPQNLSRFVCGACGSRKVQYVTGGGTGSVAGGVDWYEFSCEDCGCFTEYEHSWG